MPPWTFPGSGEMEAPSKADVGVVHAIPISDPTRCRPEPQCARATVLQPKGGVFPFCPCAIHPCWTNNAATSNAATEQMNLIYLPSNNLLARTIQAGETKTAMIVGALASFCSELHALSFLALWCWQSCDHSEVVHVMEMVVRRVAFSQLMSWVSWITWRKKITPDKIIK